MEGACKKLLRCTEAVKKKISLKPGVALILGSGLGDYAKEMRVKDIPVAAMQFKDLVTETIRLIGGTL